jgi:hypothetical protein
VKSNDSLGSPLIPSTVSFDSPANGQGVPREPSRRFSAITPPESITAAPVLATSIPGNPLTPRSLSLPNGSFSMEREWVSPSHSEQLQRSKSNPIGGGNSAVSPTGSTNVDGRKFSIFSRTTLTTAGMLKQSGSFFVGSGLTGDVEWLELHSWGRSSPGFNTSEPDDPRWWEPQVLTHVGTKSTHQAAIRCRQSLPEPRDKALLQHQRTVTVKQLISL